MPDYKLLYENLFNEVIDLIGLHIHRLQVLRAESTRLHREEDAPPLPPNKESGA